MAYRIIIQPNWVEIWASGDVSSDVLKALAQHYKKTGALVVVYKSGHADLVESTADLLQAQLGETRLC